MKTVATDKKLHALIGHRIDLIEMAGMLEKRLASPAGYYCSDRAQKLLDAIKKDINDLGVEITSLVKANEAMSKRAELIVSVPGVDEATALILAADMPWLGKPEVKEGEQVVDVGPYTKETGMYINGESAIQRRELYTAALTASKFNKKMRDAYEKLIKMKKKPDAAIVAIMHKLIVAINSMLSRGAKWVDSVEVPVASAPVSNRASTGVRRENVRRDNTQYGEKRKYYPKAR